MKQILANHNTNKLISELERINKYVFQVCGMELTNVEAELESEQYHAHTFELNHNNCNEQKLVKFRVAKSTPTKTAGQFVSIWKRNASTGITEPHNISDQYEYYIIAAREESKFGVFIFNKSILGDNKILSNEYGEGGKRGIRVYPAWSVTSSKQAQTTQQWQQEYFVEIAKDGYPIDANKAKKLMNLT